MINIGYFRFNKKNDSMQTKKLNAIAHNFLGMNLIFFEPKDIIYDKKMVQGTSYTDSGWIKKIVPLPKVINNIPFRSKASREGKLYTYLNSNSLLLNHSFGAKNEVEQLLVKKRLLLDFIIPSTIVLTPYDVIDMSRNSSKLIVKPIDGNRGEGIFMVEKLPEEDSSYLITKQEGQSIISTKELVDMTRLLKGEFIIQEFVESKTSKGLPFDIRVHYEKNGKGKWTKAQVYARVGIINDVVSNIAKGGSVIRAGLFLRREYGEVRGREIIQKLNNKLKGFPSKFESLYNFNVSTIALDLGLEHGKFSLFEINSFPGGTFARGEVSMLRASHARYLVNKLALNKTETIKSYKDLEEEIKILANENKRLKNKAANHEEAMIRIKGSKSWRYTSVFRKR